MNIFSKICKVALVVSLPLVGVGEGLLLTSCENDGFYYQDEARVRLEGPAVWALGTDSLVYSFSTEPDDTKENVMDIDVCVMGPVADHDRTANIVVDAAKTTASTDQYSVPATAVIPAGKNKGTLSVTLKRDESLTKKTVRLQIAVAQSSDFSIGVNEQNHFTLIWSDQIAKPKNWNTLEEFFGTFSIAKYRFMLQNSPKGTEFSTETMSWSLLNSYRIKFAAALEKYNADHPGAPLTDENNQLVTF